MQITNKDALPHFICTECYKTLKNTFYFRSKCFQSEAKFKSSLINTNYRLDNGGKRRIINSEMETKINKIKIVECLDDPDVNMEIFGELSDSRNIRGSLVSVVKLGVTDEKTQKKIDYIPMSSGLVPEKSKSVTGESKTITTNSKSVSKDCKSIPSSCKSIPINSKIIPTNSKSNPTNSKSVSTDTKSVSNLDLIIPIKSKIGNTLIKKISKSENALITKEETSFASSSFEFNPENQNQRSGKDSINIKNHKFFGYNFLQINEHLYSYGLLIDNVR